MGQEIRPYSRGNPPGPAVRGPVAGIGFAASAAVWLMEQALPGLIEEWSVSLPWGWMALAFAAFGVGQFIADWSNHRSWLRRRWQSYRSFFELLWVVTPLKTEADGREALKVRVKLRFTRPVRNASVLIIASTVQPVRRQTEKIVSGQSYEPDEEIAFDIATIGRDEHQLSYWGANPANVIFNGGRYIVDFQVACDKGTQAFKIRMDMMQRNAGTMGRVWVMPEQDIFSI